MFSRCGRTCAGEALPALSESKSRNPKLGEKKLWRFETLKQKKRFPAECSEDRTGRRSL